MVIFTSNRPLNRAENIQAVYNAFDASKKFTHTSVWYQQITGSFTLRVSDEFVGAQTPRTILIGHGISGGKYYGLDQRFPYYRKEFAKKLAYVVTTSEDMREIAARQSGVPIDRVVALGMPRTDAMIGKKKGDGCTVMQHKRAYLYAPTFRNIGETPFFDIDWDYIDKRLNDDELLVIKPHMNMRRVLTKEYRHIIEVPSNEPSTPYLIDCDVLITDYSSIMFDAHVLEKPVVLFEKTKGYTETRGMYLKYPDEYSSRYCTNEADLVDILWTANEPGEVDIRCKNLTASMCDGHSSERVVKLIKDTECEF